jgi:hypothetical protein
LVIHANKSGPTWCSPDESVLLTELAYNTLDIVVISTGNRKKTSGLRTTQTVPTLPPPITESQGQLKPLLTLSLTYHHPHQVHCHFSTFMGYPEAVANPRFNELQDFKGNIFSNKNQSVRFL